MKKLAALAVIASLFALAMPETSDAEQKIRIRSDHWRISCNTARHMVRERGFKQVKIKSCVSTVYSFYAVRNGRTYIFYVDSQTRALWQG